MENKLREMAIKLERCFLELTDAYDKQPKETSNKRLKRLGREYGIKIITSDSIYARDIRYDAPTNAQISAVGGAFEKHLRIYPKQIIEASRIEQIVFARNLQALGYNKKFRRVAGIAQTGYDVVDTLFIDANSIIQKTWHGKRLFHHELYHAIDYRDTWFGHLDTDWKALQGENYRYGMELYYDYLAALNKGLAPPEEEFDYEITGLDAVPSDAAGFVSDYSRVSYVEDKAEIYASLITEYSALIRRAQKDLPIERKVERMKELLHKFSPAYNEDFWQMREGEKW